MFIADRKTGETLEYFDPGRRGLGDSHDSRVTAACFVMSNRGILYAFDIE